MKKSYVYIITNKNHTVLYTGITSDLKKRITEHKNKTGSLFTRRYNCTKLVYYEEYLEISKAIIREKQIKSGSRAKKIELIKKLNPNWSDLYHDL